MIDIHVLTDKLQLAARTTDPLGLRNPNSLQRDVPRSCLGIAATIRHIEHADRNVKSAVRQSRNSRVKRPKIAYTVRVVIAGGRWNMAYDPNLEREYED